MSRATRKAASAELAECARLRSVATGAPPVPGKPLPTVDAGVLVTFSADEARKAGATIDMRGKDATLSATRAASYGIHADGETEWKHGKPISYTRATHDNYVRSVGLIVTPSTLDFAFHATRKLLTLPTGYSWSTDANGLRIVRDASPTDDYHPSAGQLLATQFPGNCIRHLDANRLQRILMSAEAAASGIGTTVDPVPWKSRRSPACVARGELNPIEGMMIMHLSELSLEELENAVSCLCDGIGPHVH